MRSFKDLYSKLSDSLRDAENGKGVSRIVGNTILCMVSFVWIFYLFIKIMKKVGDIKTSISRLVTLTEQVIR